MAKPLSPSVLAALNTTIESLTPVQIFELSVGGFLEVKEGALAFAKKAERGEKRTAKKEAIEAIRGVVFQSVTTAAGGTDKHFRLDDVLKASGLDKATHRDNILQCLRDLRDEGLLESVKLSDNNFQIFWKATPELLS
ncbi:hypothetical protein [Acinetobacter baylyi]|uniref:hypothetical protein n=1 Tax=Acinetobacter baylyi TaxID=202950 RepID=UPI0013CF79BF|nr:hypothetical protein [Acinetobacter baylyi]